MSSMSDRRAQGQGQGQATRYFGLSVVDLMSLPEHAGQSLPRIVVYLCEWLLARASKLAEARSSSAERIIEDDVRAMIEQPIDTALFTEARRQFNMGIFRDHGSKVCMFRLLKAFIRELSAPLIPRTAYDDAIASARSHMRETVAKVQASPAYPLLIQGLSSKPEDHALLSGWLARYWADGDDRPPPPHLAEECAGLVRITETVAFSVAHPMIELAELFFKLPKANKAVLEYLGVCFAKLDLLDRRGAGGMADGSAPKQSVPPVLKMLADTLAPHMLKPPSWSARSEGHRTQRKRLQEAFVMCFFYFVKRKHNLISAEERSRMNEVSEQGEEASIELLLFAKASTAVKLSHAFEAAIAIPRATPSRKTNLTPSGSWSKSPPSDSRRGSQWSMSMSGVNTSSVGQGRSGSWGSSVDSMQSSGRICKVASPPVTRQLVDAVVEVALDSSMQSVDPNDTYSFYAESGDEACGLSPTSSPAASPLVTRKSLIKLVVPSTADEKLTSISQTVAADVQPQCAGPILCDFLPQGNDGFAGATTSPLTNADVELHAPCLTRWQEEAYLPYDGETQHTFYATDPLPAGSVFKIGGAAAPAGSGVEPHIPPGELLLPILGADFTPTEEYDVRCHLMFSDSDLSEHGRSSAAGGKRRRPSSSAVPVHAINYDYALAFPRTLADTAVRRANKTIVERFLAFPLQVQKDEYVGDREFGFLNQSLPDKNSTEVQACEQCERPFGGYFSGTRRRNCRYCSKELCTKCCDRKFIIPSYIIQLGDFNVHSICQPCENHLQKHLYSACLELDRLRPAAAAVIGQDRLEQLSRTREKAMQHLYYSILPRCPARHTMLSLIPQSCVPYVSVFPASHGALVSLADLCELQTRHVFNDMERLEELLRMHVEGCLHCSQERKVCGAAHLCRREAVPDESLLDEPPATGLSVQSDSGAQVGNMTGLSEVTSRLGTSLAEHEKLLFRDQGAPPPTRELRINDDIVLCRSCATYCHRGCYETPEEQCARCAALSPDAARTPKAMSRMTNSGIAQSSNPTDIYLWDICQEHWF